MKCNNSHVILTISVAVVEEGLIQTCIARLWSLGRSSGHLFGRVYLSLYLSSWDWFKLLSGRLHLLIDHWWGLNTSLHRLWRPTISQLTNT